MIYISIPQFYYNNSVCAFFETMSHAHPDYFKLPTTVTAAAGNFPFNYWNGGYNLSHGTSMYNEIREMSDKISVPLRFNCSNICLTEEDYNDNLANEVLKLNDNGSNYIALHDLKLYQYLQSIVKNYHYVFSREAELIYDISAELYNGIINLGIFSLIEIPESKATDIDFLKEISNKKILEIPVNASCNFKCKNYRECKLHEHTAQYNFSIENNFEMCKENQGYHTHPPLITAEDIKTKYLPMGINHFAFAPVVGSSKHDILRFLIEYLIKDEYQYKMMSMYVDGGKKND